MEHFLGTNEIQHEFPFRLLKRTGREEKSIWEKHGHNAIEIVAVFCGKVRCYVNDRGKDLSEGEFLIVNSNDIHAVAIDRSGEMIVIQIPLNVFGKYLSEDHRICFEQEEENKDETFMKLIRQMYQAYQETKEGFEFRVQSLFYQILYLLVTQYRKMTEIEGLKEGKQTGRLSEIITYMEENYSRELTLEQLAQKFGYSATYLSRMFRKDVKINYKEYLTNIRLEHAYRDLRSTRMPIVDIAVNNGFPNSKAFSKAFQKIYGTLPSKYRKR